MKSYFHYLLAVAGIALMLKPSAAAAAPPPNDNFANRTVLTGQAVSSTPVTIDDATREGLERSDTGNQTVWYTWTAPQDGIVTITDEGTSQKNYAYGILSVFNGNDLANLTLIATASGNTASLTFPVKAGIIYQVCIGISYSNINGSSMLNIRNAPSTITAPVVVGTEAAVNNNLAAAVTLTDPQVSAFGYNLEAGREGLEPASTGNRTLWWTWVAPVTAQVTMTTAGTQTNGYNGGIILQVFNGDNYGNLRTVAYSRNSVATVSFPTQAGSIYRISVGAQYDVGGVEVLNITSASTLFTSPVVVGVSAAANDNFANAQDLGGNPVVSSYGFNADATTETLESPKNGSNTLWWTWTAPATGNLAISTSGTDVSHILTVSIGDNLSSLNSGDNIAGTPTNAATAGGPIVAGTAYHFAIGTKSSSSFGTLVLNLNFTPSTPKVHVSAGDPEAFEEGSQKGSFILVRDGDTSQDLLVHYTIRGSAQGNYDYLQLPGTRKIKAGRSTAVVKVIPIDHGINGIGGKVAVKLTIDSADGYQVGDPSSAKVKIFRRE